MWKYWLSSVLYTREGRTFTVVVIVSLINETFVTLICNGRFFRSWSVNLSKKPDISLFVVAFLARISLVTEPLLKWMLSGFKKLRNSL